MRNLILLGAPGVGKGVQGNLLKEKYNIPRISTGDILREEVSNKSAEGIEAENYMKSGKLVPDTLINTIVEKRLKRDDCANGFIFDGYPRTIKQAEYLNDILEKIEKNINNVISIEVDEDVIITRLSNRRVCLKCGAVYNMITDPPPENGECRKCGGEVILRDDDREETIRKRLDVYKNETEPLKKYYDERGLLVVVDGDDDIEKIFNEIVLLLDK
ncbi:adenylate kinase [bacterium]|nr:adenylate kinase [bacterium]